MPEIAGRDGSKHMAATLDDELADLRRTTAELQQKLDGRTAELTDALEREAATTEVLQVITSSPGDLTPLFDAMLERALRLCEATFGALHTFDGEAVHTVALRNVPAAFAEFLTRAPLRLDPTQSLLGKCIHERRIVHISDRAAEES